MFESRLFKCYSIISSKHSPNLFISSFCWCFALHSHRTTLG